MCRQCSGWARDDNKENGWMQVACRQQLQHKGWGVVVCVCVCVCSCPYPLGVRASSEWSKKKKKSWNGTLQEGGRGRECVALCFWTKPPAGVPAPRALGATAYPFRVPDFGGF
eukprot:Sspe_Gene.103438::Locus_79246_Transcript_1_1_Confidence_1.000_Length_458::g.103438::m.103438